MSRKVATLVYDRRIGSAARKAVLAYFADRADDFGRGIYSSKQTIADETELGRSTVIRVVNEFVAEGILKVTGSKPCKNGATTLYDIDLAAVEALPGARSDRPKQSQSGTRPDQDQSQSGTPPVPERDPKQSQSGTQTIHEPSLNQRESADALSARASDITIATDEWNAAASRQGWPTIEKVTDARRAALKARLREANGIDGWRIALGKAEASDFLNARAGPEWRGFCFDWAVKAANFRKIMEGNYDNRTDKAPFSRTSSGRSFPGGDRQPDGILGAVMRSRAARAN